MLQISYNTDLRPLNTFGLRGFATATVRYDNAEDLQSAISDRSLPRPFKAIGSGSNLLFTGDFPGTLLLNNDTSMDFAPSSDGSVIARIGAGTLMDDFCAECCRRNLWGTENLSGIPGTAGASAVQNVGAYGIEAGDLIVKAETFDTERCIQVTFTKEEMQFGYRDSMFKHIRDRYIILAVTYLLKSDYSPTLKYTGIRSLADRYPEGNLTPSTVRDEILSLRDSKLPGTNRYGSAGSFFKNPVVSQKEYEFISKIHPDCEVPSYILADGSRKISAAWLIDRAGCKTMCHGGAAVWPRQPLVLYNATGEATASDVITLRQNIISAVKNRYGVTLYPEVEQIGNL